MKQFYLFLICTLFCNLGHSQNFVWAKQLGGASSDNATSICTDVSGNVYSAGTFSGTSDFDPGSTTFNLTATAGGYDIYVSKLNSSGVFQWAVRIGNASTEYLNGLATDPSGNVYATGSFSGTVDFNPSATINNLISAGGLDIFVLKLTTGGGYSWAKRMGGIAADQGNAIVVDNSSNVYTTGYYSATANFNPAGTYTLSNVGTKDIYVSCLNSLGNFVWAQAMSGTTDEEGLGISISGTTLFVTGYFTGSTDFDRQTSVGYLTSFGQGDIFVSRRNTSTGGNGNTIQLGGTSDDRGFSVANDLSGNVLVTGYFRGLADFDPDASVANLGSTAGGYDAFICKLDGTINMLYIWASKIGSSSYDVGQAIKTDALNNVYTTGNFGDVADFDPGAPSYTITPGSMDVFVSKLTASGTFVWAKSWGSTGGGDEGKGIALDASGNVYTTGRFTNTCDFDPSAAIYSLTTAGSDEIFVHKLSCTLPSTITSSATNYTLCVGTSATNTINIPSPEAGVTYSWSAVGATGVTFSPITGTTTVMSYTASTSFSIVASGTNPCGTVSTTVSAVLVNTLPAVSASASPTAVCTGSLLTLTGGGATSYSWSNGVTNGSAFTPTASLTYTVMGTDINACTNTATINVASINNPTVSVTGNSVACLNKANTLMASGANTYTWLPGSIANSTINAQPLTNASYTVNATASNGCNNFAVFSVNILTPPTPDICEVTVDSLSNYNEIYWQKTLYPQADSFFVYREVSTNIYVKIGGRSAADSSMFIDTLRSIGPAKGNPNLTAYKYKIQLKDSCGNYSAKSLWHQTIFIQDQQNGNFNWNSYAIESTASPVSNYNLIRRDIAGVETLVGSTTSNIFTDPAYNTFWPLGHKWFVDAIGFNCDPTLRVVNPDGTLAQKVKTKSNHANDRIGPTNLGNLNSVNGKSIIVYPNPAKDRITIELGVVNENLSIELNNVLGQTIYSVNTTESINTINTSNYVSGVYFLNIKLNNKVVAVKKVVLQ